MPKKRQKKLMKEEKIKMGDYDFCGWATKSNMKCSDGRTIMKDAFKDNDGKTVPLIWNHRHDGVNEVLGHALLENRDEGVYEQSRRDGADAAHARRRTDVGLHG